LICNADGSSPTLARAMLAKRARESAMKKATLTEALAALAIGGASPSRAVAAQQRKTMMERRCRKKTGSYTIGSIPKAHRNLRVDRFDVSCQKRSIRARASEPTSLLPRVEATDEIRTGRQIILHLHCLLLDHKLRWRCAGMLRVMVS
jgi:hypothetical protein